VRARARVFVHVYGIFHVARASPFPFLGVFAKLRKATISFVKAYLSVRPSAYNNSASNRRIFMKSLYFSIFPKSVEKNQVSLNYDKNNRHCTCRPKCIYDNILPKFFLK
jgi:hypothetical protein